MIQDSFGRTITYMRVSVTDRCNLNCLYCRPHTADCLREQELLSLSELLAVCEAASALGIKRFKITGGEPLLRPGLADFIKALKEKDIASEVTLTTNGVLLQKQLDSLVLAGLDGVTLSLDTLDCAHYHRLTGGQLSPVWEGFAAALKAPLSVKINAVLSEQSPQELIALACLARSHPIAVRFITRMDLGPAQTPGMDAQSLIRLLKQEGLSMRPVSCRLGNGPACYVRVEGFRGHLGFIDAVHEKFCASCNRIRLTPEGCLKPCLYYKDAIDLKKILRKCDNRPSGSLSQKELLIAAVRQAVAQKPACHHFETPGLFPEKETLPMSRIGG